MNRTFVLRTEQNAASLHAFLKANARSMADSGHPLAVVVTEHKAKRSADQNKYLWVVLGHIAECAWLEGRQFSAEAWHHYFKCKFIGMEDSPSGAPCPISTTTLSVPEFAEYIEKISNFAVSELGVEFTL